MGRLAPECRAGIPFPSTPQAEEEKEGAKAGEAPARAGPAPPLRTDHREGGAEEEQTLNEKPGQGDAKPAGKKDGDHGSKKHQSEKQ